MFPIEKSKGSNLKLSSDTPKNAVINLEKHKNGIGAYCSLSSLVVNSKNDLSIMFKAKWASSMNIDLCCR